MITNNFIKNEYVHGNIEDILKDNPSYRASLKSLIGKNSFYACENLVIAKHEETTDEEYNKRQDKAKELFSSCIINEEVFNRYKDMFKPSKEQYMIYITTSLLDKHNITDYTSNIQPYTLIFKNDPNTFDLIECNQLLD